MPTCTVHAAGRDWLFAWPHRPGAVHRLLADVTMVRPPAKPEEVPPEERAALGLEWIDYQDATWGVQLAAVWSNDALPAMSRRAHPQGETPAGDLWPLAKGDNARTYGLAVVDDLYAMGWRPGEVADAVVTVSQAIAAWLGPQPARAEVEEARDFCEAPTGAATG